MKLRLERRWPKNGYTIGILYVDGIRFCETLEDQVRDVNKNGRFDGSERKVYGETAIPYGSYKVDMNTVSQSKKTRDWARRYGGIVPRLMNVPSFDGILIHPGNKPVDTLGCILVGRNTVVGKLTSSTATYYRLMDEHLMPAKRRNETVTIEIV